MIMSRKQLKQFNDKMLGLGAPVEIDGVGYNKPDYMNMSSFANTDFQKWTDRQCWFIAVTLGRYKNTQLKTYKVAIEDTIDHYHDITEADKSKAAITILQTSEKVVRLSWKYNAKVREFISSMDRKKYLWTKEGNKWIFSIGWDYLDELITGFKAAGMSTTELQKLNREHQKPTTNPKPVVYNGIKLQVVRQPQSIDTLEIQSEYSPDLIQVYRTIPNMFWNPRKQCWVVYMENVAELYDAIPNSFDKSTLKPWADIVRGWSKQYPLVDYHQLPLKFQPYEYQPSDAQHLLNLKVGLNANEVGCGKTFEQVLIGESIPMKKLVICPATLRLNWEREIHMVNPEAVVHIQYSNQPFKAVDGWNIIGYPSLKKFQEQLESEKFQVVMADEAHFIQAVSSNGSPDSQRARAVLRIAATAQYVYPITGTPKTNRNANVYNLLRMMRHPLTRGKMAFHTYAEYYCNAQSTRWGWDYSGNSHDQELNEVLKPIMVRHLKQDVLPHLQKQRQAIPMSVNLREYNRLIDEYLEIRGKRGHEAEALVTLNRAKQVVAIQKVKETIAFAKDIMEQGEKVVIATCYTEVVRQIQAEFPKCLTIVGGMSDGVKQQAIDWFQNMKDRNIMVINYEAGGVGVTLTSSSTMIMNDLPWIVGAVEQAEGRIWRSGQTRTAMIYFMVASGCPMDEKLVDTIVYKSQTINQAVDSGMGDELDLRKLIEDSLTH